MARNRKLELNGTVPGQWVTTDGRFGVLKKPMPINPMEGTFDFKIRYTFSVRDLRGEDTYPQFMQLSPELAQVDSFKEVFPWLGKYTGEGSFDTEDPERSVPKGVTEDVLTEEAITKRWLTGVKKWWKQWVKGASRISRLTDPKHKSKVLDYVSEGERRLKRIKSNLDFQKGAALYSGYVTGDRKKDIKANKGLDPRVDLAYMFEDAVEKVRDIRSRLEHWWAAVYDETSHEYEMSNHGGEWGVEGNKSGATKSLNAYEAEVSSMPESVGDLDKIVSGRIFRRLNRFVTQVTKRVSQFGGGQINLGSEGIREFNVGRMKVVVDTGRSTVTAIAQAGNPDSIHYDKYRHPKHAFRYMGFMKKAKALIVRAGFGKAWYGVTKVRPGGESYEFTTKDGAKHHAGGHYDVMADEIVTFQDAQEVIVATMVHEVGHRWYYRFMNKVQRGMFDSYFGGHPMGKPPGPPVPDPVAKGKVRAVSSYGGTSSVEDFAEVFKWYVLGKKLNRDQRERFKEFALKVKGKRIRRQEDAARMRDTLLG